MEGEKESNMNTTITNKLVIIIQVVFILFSIFLVFEVPNDTILEQNYKIIDENVATTESFLDGDVCDMSELYFTGNGEVQGYQTWVDLTKGDGFLIEFDVDNFTEDDGILHVDLYNEEYDPVESEYFSIGYTGKSSDSTVIYYNNTSYPQKSQLRIFETGDVSADVRNLTVKQIKSTIPVDGGTFLVGAIILDALAITIYCIHRNYKGNLTKQIVTTSLIMIIMLQVVTMIYWARQKSNYYVDECYSMGYAHNYSENVDTPQYVYLDDAWKEGQWVSADHMKELLIVNKEGSILDQSFMTTLTNFVKGRHFFILLNIVESIIKPGEISKVPGISFNIIIFILTQLVLFCIMRLLDSKDITALLAVFTYGFCGIAVGLVQYIRFYTWTIFLLSLALLLHLFMWKSEKILHWVLCEVASLVLIFLGIKNSELILALGAALIGCFAILLLIRKKWLQAGIYIVPFFAGGIWFMANGSDYLNAIIHWKQYAEVAANFNGKGDVGRLEQMMLQLSQLTLSGIIDRTRECIELIERYLFGIKSIAILFALLLTVVFIWAVINSFKNDKKTIILDSNDGFALIILLVIGAFTLFSSMTMVIISRYYSFVFILLVIVVWHFIDRKERKCTNH